MNTQRLPFLDGLRVAAFLLLIPYHVGMYYVTWDWHVKSPAASHVLEPFMLMSAPWRLGLLFLVAGAACHDLLARRGVAGTLKDRTKRLLLPLIFGMLVIVPPQTYFELLTKAPELMLGDGSYLSFWAAYLKPAHLCRGKECLDVPTWNHLWFVAYLWPYAVIATLVVAAARRLPWRPRPVAMPTWAWLLVPALPLIVARLAVLPHFPSTHNFVVDPYNHLIFGWLFALGWASRTPWAEGLWPHAQRARWPALVLAVLGWALWQTYAQGWLGLPAPPAVMVLQRTVWALMSWWAIVAACGFAQRLFATPRPWVRAVSKGVFCAYILHQTVIVLLTQALRPVALPWGLEALLVLLLTFGLCALAYLGLRRVPLVRGLVGVTAP